MIINSKNVANISNNYKCCFPHFWFCEKQMRLILCFYVLRFSVILRESGNLFQIFKAMYERFFCPWFVFRKGWFDFRKDALVVVLFRPDCWNKSFIYAEVELLKDFLHDHLWIPYRTKQCRTKVTKFFAGDENFDRRKILSGE